MAGVRRISVAVALPLLVTKRVKLPALSVSERRNILMLESDRFFADRSHGFVRASNRHQYRWREPSLDPSVGTES